MHPEDASPSNPDGARDSSPSTSDGATDVSLSNPDGGPTSDASAGADADAGAPRDAGADAAASALPFFYGGNAHYDYDWTTQQIVDHLHQVGMTMLRMNTGGFAGLNVGRVRAFATGIAAIDPNIKLLAAIDAGFDPTADETTNYMAGFRGAQFVAQELGPAGVTDFECGNELLTNAAVYPHAGVPGDRPSDYTGGRSWQAMRGAIRGMIDGVKSVNAAYRAGVNFTIAQIAGSDMLWNGVEPDGSAGHPTVRWDITTWHNYEVYGDLFHIGTEAHGSDFNLIAYVAEAYHRPIMITEWNTNPEDTDAQKAPYTTHFLQEMYDNRLMYGIESTMLYQLAGGPPDYGLFVFPQQTAAYAAFTAAHPTR